jgi:predicted nucleic acid-binding protein
MRIVVDAYILVGQLSRVQGRDLLSHGTLQLLITERAWSETWHEFPQRLQRRVAAGTFSAEAVAGTLDIARRLADANITRVTEEIYSPYKDEAHLRIPDDPNDWHTLALALVTRTDIWTEDRHFFGCGVAVWRTPQLRAMLERAPQTLAE